MMDFDLIKDFDEQIETRLYDIHESAPIPVSNFKRSMKYLDPKFIYASEKYCLPYFISPAISANRVDRFYFDVFFNAIKDEHPTLVSSGVEEAVENGFKNCYPPETLHLAISSKLNNLVYDYNKVLAITRERDYLQGIQDEEKIILNHLNRYYRVLNSADLQIDISMGLIFSKEISDLFLKALIKFLEHRLTILNPQSNNVNEASKKLDTKKESQFRFVWNGTQKELLELMVGLQKNNWINEIPKNQLTQAGKAICNLFDITTTKKTPNSDPVNSFVQILKGEVNPDTSKRDFAKHFSEDYNFKFDGIQPNEI